MFKTFHQQRENSPKRTKLTETSQSHRIPITPRKPILTNFARQALETSKEKIWKRIMNDPKWSNREGSNLNQPSPQEPLVSSWKQYMTI